MVALATRLLRAGSLPTLVTLPTSHSPPGGGVLIVSPIGVGNPRGWIEDRPDVVVDREPAPCVVAHAVRGNGMHLHGPLVDDDEVQASGGQNLREQGQRRHPGAGLELADGGVGCAHGPGQPALAQISHSTGTGHEATHDVWIGPVRRPHES